MRHSSFFLGIAGSYSNTKIFFGGSIVRLLLPSGIGVLIPTHGTNQTSRNFGTVVTLGLVGMAGEAVCRMDLSDRVFGLPCHLLDRSA